MEEVMPFRVKIISPIKIDEADLRRRRMRYGEHAGPDTHIEVFNLPEGPTTLDTLGDMLFCEHAVFQEGMRTSPNDFDAILIDCVFDPAVEALRSECPVPTFGPMRATLPLVIQVAPRFSYIARAERQTQWLVELAQRYGYGEWLVSARALGITYQESRNPTTFDNAMIQQLRQVIDEDKTRAVVMGSTTMAVSDRVEEAAAAVPLFLPGMVALRVMEVLWADGLLAQDGAT
jgi:allantoin racemase